MRASFGILVVAQEPGVAVELRREDHGAVEGLQDEVVLPVVEARREAHPVVLGEPLELRRQARVRAPRRGGGWRSRGSPCARRCRSRRPSQRKVVAWGSALPRASRWLSRMRSGLCSAARSIMRMKASCFSSRSCPHTASNLKSWNSVVAAELRSCSIRAASSSGVSPNPSGPSHTPSRLPNALGLLGQIGPKPSGNCPRNLPRPGRAVEALAVDRPGVEGVDVEHHPVLVVQPLEERQVGQGLRFGGALVGVVDPGEVVERDGVVSSAPGKTFSCDRARERRQ